MTQSKVKQLLIDNKAGLILGFIFGAFIAPFLAILGLGIALFEVLRPLLIGPMDFIGNFIPNVQTGPHTYYVPIHKWILTLGGNGVCYAILGGIIQSLFRDVNRLSQK